MHLKSRQAADWPHSEAPALYLGVSGVALAAALVLVVASLVRNHRLLELVVQAALLGLVAVRMARMVDQYRALKARSADTMPDSRTPDI